MSIPVAATVISAALLFLTAALGIVSSIVQGRIVQERDHRREVQVEADRHYVEALVEKRLREAREHMDFEMRVLAEANAKALAEQTAELVSEARANREATERVEQKAEAAYQEANQINNKLVNLGVTHADADRVTKK